jgi:hypothetical protein
VAEHITLMASRKVFEDCDLSIHMRFDTGKWTVESYEKRSGKTTSASFNPPAMDAIVRAWPSFQQEMAA